MPRAPGRPEDTHGDTLLAAFIEDDRATGLDAPPCSTWRHQARAIVAAAAMRARGGKLRGMAADLAVALIRHGQMPPHIDLLDMLAFRSRLDLEIEAVMRQERIYSIEGVAMTLILASGPPKALPARAKIVESLRRCRTTRASIRRGEICAATPAASGIVTRAAGIAGAMRVALRRDTTSPLQACPIAFGTLAIVAPPGLAQVEIGKIVDFVEQGADRSAVADAVFAFFGRTMGV